MKEISSLETMEQEENVMRATRDEIYLEEVKIEDLIRQKEWRITKILSLK